MLLYLKKALFHISVSPPKHIPGRAGGGWEDDDDLEVGQGHTRSSGSGSAGLADR